VTSAAANNALFDKRAGENRGREKVNRKKRERIGPKEEGVKRQSSEPGEIKKGDRFGWRSKRFGG